MDPKDQDLEDTEIDCNGDTTEPEEEEFHDEEEIVEEEEEETVQEECLDEEDFVEEEEFVEEEDEFVEEEEEFVEDEEELIEEEDDLFPSREEGSDPGYVRGGCPAATTLVDENLDSEEYAAMHMGSEFYSATEVESEGSKGKVMQYGDSKVLKNAILEQIDEDVRGTTSQVYSGIAKLKKAIQNKELRRGQLIFGTVTPAHHSGTDGTFEGYMSNLFAPIYFQITAEQSRQYAYLHAAIYAGKHKGKHYVIENGGHYGEGIGMVDVEELDEAFEKDAQFFILQPKRDSSGKSTRYMVLQRALACCGLYYEYHLRAVSCEAFALTVMNFRPVYEPLQSEVIPPDKKHPMTPEKKKADKKRFETFFAHLSQRLDQIQELSLLTLRYYIDSVNDADKYQYDEDNPQSLDELNAIKPWFHQMSADYDKMFKAIEDASDSNYKKQVALVQKLVVAGLDANTKHTYEGERMTPWGLASYEDCTPMKECLKKLGAITI